MALYFNDYVVENEAGAVLRTNGFQYSSYAGEWYRDCDCWRSDHDDQWYPNSAPSIECQSCGCTYGPANHDRLTTVDSAQHYCCADCATDDDCERDRNGYWHSDGIIDNELRLYSDKNPRMDSADSMNPYRIGFEVEKEDYECRHNDCRGIQTYAESFDWIAVGDGSLNVSDGFELVSPAYNLSNHDEIVRTLESYDMLDAGSSSACGGHITISDYRYTGEELLEKIDDAIPLIYSLWPNRAGADYCDRVRKSGCYNGQDKYKAIHVKENCIEIRLPSRVKTGAQLLWRYQLFAYILQHDNRAPIAEDLYNCESFLHRHLRKVYTLSQVKSKRSFYRSLRLWWEENSAIFPTEIATDDDDEPTTVETVVETAQRSSNGFQFDVDGFIRSAAIPTADDNVLRSPYRTYAHSSVGLLRAAESRAHEACLNPECRDMYPEVFNVRERIRQVREAVEARYSVLNECADAVLYDHWRDIIEREIYLQNQD